MKRAIVIILDGVGIGELPDAHTFGDEGSHTLRNLAQAVGGLYLPNLERLGLGKIDHIPGLKSALDARANYGKMAELSAGKDSTTGHWELAGMILHKPFPTYPDGFPEDIIDEFTRLTGFGVIGNKAASGTEIIKELGEEHLRSGRLIVYTSADSVFQIAAHEKVLPLEKLYEVCEIARDMLSGEHAVARVIARPFIGDNAENFVRTAYRKDFSLAPFSRILHQNLKEAGWPTVGIGKINDLYARTGISKSVYTKTNEEGMQAILEQMAAVSRGLIMANLVDFDMLWGHRNNPDGFYAALKAFDKWLPDLFAVMEQEDFVMLTADHGNDPTTPSTDHSREYVPLLVFGPELSTNRQIGTRSSFADLAATLAEYFEIPSTGEGSSFLNLVRG